MKKLLLLGFIVSLFTLTAEAQWGSCVPDQLYADSTFGVYPSPNPSGGIAATACINEPWQYAFTFKIPETVTVSGLTADLDSVAIDTEGAVAGLPTGIKYACNPPDCVFTPEDTLGCLALYGTVNDTAGMYELKITAYVATNLVSSDFVLPGAPFNDPEDKYVLKVEPEGTAGCLVGTNDALKSAFQVRNVPNPFSAYTNIEITAEYAEDLQFKVFDLLGNEIHQRIVKVSEGKNAFEFDGSQMSNGIYMYTIEKEGAVVTGKMIINK